MQAGKWYLQPVFTDVNNYRLPKFTEIGWNMSKLLETCTLYSIRIQNASVQKSSWLV